MSSSLLVTGFGPFEGVPENPSERLARTSGEQFEIIDVHYQKTRQFIEALDPSSFDVLLMLGCHGTASQMILETNAHNRIHQQVDISGFRPPGATIRRGEPISMHGSLWQSLNLEGSTCPSAMSSDAGSYLCNFIYYEALRRFPNHRVGFLHVPTFDRLAESEQTKFLAQVIAEIKR